MKFHRNSSSVPPQGASSGAGESHTLLKHDLRVPVPQRRTLLAGSCSPLAGVSLSCKGQCYQSTQEFLHRESRFIIPRCFLPYGFSSASFFSPREMIIVQIVAGFFPKPNLASYAHFLVVKRTEVIFPSGICFLTKPKDLVAHKTWVLPSDEAPCGFSRFGVAICFARQYKNQHSARERKKKGCSPALQEAHLPEGFSKSRQSARLPHLRR